MKSGETNMRNFYSLSIFLCSCLLISCSTLPTSFSTENIMKTRPGMTSDEILAMYGEPKSIKNTTCGSATDNPWSCTIWEYGEFPYDRATFYFSGEHGSYILNNFDIERD
jgi:hypothetical protein